MQAPLLPVLIGYFFCLAVMHRTLLLDGLGLGWSWLSSALSIIWPQLCQAYQVVGPAPVAWLVPLIGLVLVNLVPVKPPPAPEAPPPPRWMRRRLDQARQRHHRKESQLKPASIHDYGFSKAYPRRLRVARQYHRRPHNPDC